MAVEFVAQWLHIIVSIFWFGSVMFGDFVLMPAIAKMTPAGQRDFGVHVGSRIPRIMTPVAILSIGLGVIRGVAFGDIGSLDQLFGTAYGLTWLLALVAAVATFSWRMWVVAPTLDGMSKVATPAEASAAAGRLRSLVMIELVGFLVVFTTMIAMHFE